MPQYVEAFGQTIEFPDGMSAEQIGAAIKKSAMSIPRDKVSPQIANDAISQGARDPTIGMNEGEKFRAGMGKAFADLGRGAGQWLGLVDRPDVAESRKLDAPLMRAGAGLSGDIAGNAAMLLPTALIPGANSLPVAAGIGAITGALQPSTSTGETVKNIAIGGVAAPATLGLVRGGQALYQGAKGLVEPFTQSGQERLAAEVLQRSATDPTKAIQAAAQARQLVPGSESTLAQVANDPGLAQLERTIMSNPEYAGALQARQGAQKVARLNTIQDIAGRGDHYDEIRAGRDLFAKQDYANAMSAGVDQDMAKALQPQIANLMERPSIQAAQRDAIRLAKESGDNLTDFGSVKGLDWLKKALDNKISIASNPGSSIGKADLAALVQTKNDLMATLEQIAPAYKEANQNYAAMSGQINSMDVARSLLDKLNKPGSQYLTAGTAKEMGGAYRGALSNSFDSVKKATGLNKDITQVMPPQDIAALENIARDLGRKEFAQTAGLPTGSPTAQNLASQNMLRRILGPTGLPETWAESNMLQGLLSPIQMGSKLSGADKKIMDRIARGLLDPADGIGLLSRPAQIQSINLLGAPATQRLLPATGLLSVGQ